MCESCSALFILTAALLGNYCYYYYFAEGEMEALPGFKVFAFPCICYVPYGEGRIQSRSLKEVRLSGESPVSSPNHVPGKFT